MKGHCGGHWERGNCECAGWRAVHHVGAQCSSSAVPCGSSSGRRSWRQRSSRARRPDRHRARRTARGQRSAPGANHQSLGGEQMVGGAWHALNRSSISSLPPLWNAANITSKTSSGSSLGEGPSAARAPSTAGTTSTTFSIALLSCSSIQHIEGTPNRDDGRQREASARASSMSDEAK